MKIERTFKKEHQEELKKEGKHGNISEIERKKERKKERKNMRNRI